MNKAGKLKIWFSSILLGSLLLTDLSYAAPVSSVYQEAAAKVELAKGKRSKKDDDAPYLMQTDLQIVKGQTKKLMIGGRGAYTAKFESDNPAVAAVDGAGNVRGRREGTCQIRAKINGEWFYCRVQVKKIAFAADRITIAKNRQTKLNLTGVTTQKVQWESSNPNVAAVTQKGILQGKRAGQCKITASVKGVSCTLKVTVKKTDTGSLQQTYTKTGKENQKKILLIGSSSVDYWKSSATAFSPYTVVNMGIAGSKTTYWLEWYKKLVTDYNPAAVVIYVGSNDIRHGKSVKGVDNAANTIELIQKIHRELPGIPVFYVGLCHVWLRVNGWKEVDASNAAMKKFCDTQDNVYYIDVGSHMLNDKGLPQKKLYRSDQIHPNDKGYKIWDKYIGKRVVRIMRKRK